MIEVSGHGDVAVLTMARGPVNALDVELLTAFPAALHEVADAAAVVLTGAGRCFSAGVGTRSPRNNCTRPSTNGSRPGANGTIRASRTCGARRPHANA